MNKKMEKNYYNAPSVKVVSFKVDNGYYLSKMDIGDTETGTQMIIHNQESDEWAGSVING